MVTPICIDGRDRRPTSATSPTWPRSAAWRPARSRRPRRTSTRRACGCRRSACSGGASRSRTSGGSCSPTTARRPTRWGDLHAMLGSLRVGERRLRQLFDERGVETADRRPSGASRTSPTASCARRSAKLPDGVYYGEDSFDDDGISDRPYWVRLAVIVDGDELIFDYCRSDEQAIGPINAPYVVTLSASLNGLLYVLGRNIPVNAGLNRAIRVVAPAGTICCVRLPGCLRRRPDRVPAAGHGDGAGHHPRPDPARADGRARAATRR